jgi:hypothetical protein
MRDATRQIIFFKRPTDGVVTAEPPLKVCQSATFAAETAIALLTKRSPTRSAVNGCNTWSHPLNFNLAHIFTGVTETHVDPNFRQHRCDTRWPLDGNDGVTLRQ